MQDFLIRRPSQARNNPSYYNVLEFLIRARKELSRRILLLPRQIIPIDKWNGMLGAVLQSVSGIIAALEMKLLRHCYGKYSFALGL